MILSFRRRLAAVVLLIVGLLVHYALGRGVFLWLNADSLFRQPSHNIALAFLHGFRFDVAALFVLNAPFLLWLILPLPCRQEQQQRLSAPRLSAPRLSALRTACIVLVNVPFLWLGIADAEYYKFTGKRSGADLAVFARDAFQQSASLVQQYWPLVLFALFQAVLFWLLARSVEKVLQKKNTRGASPLVPLKWVREAAGFVFFCALVAIGIRGGLQRKPLTTTHAYVFEANILNVFSLNSTLTVLHAGRHKGVTSVSFFDSLSSARSYWETPSEGDGSAEPVLAPGEAPWTLRPTMELPQGGRFNIVVVVVESLGREFMGTGNPWPGFTPFLDSLVKEGVLFDDSFANGRRSIEAPWSLFAGIPSLMDEPYVSSAYKDNSLTALPRVLREEGYASIFFHGGKNGTMFFDTFARMAGFQRYVGLNESPPELQKSAYDGTWGIFDGPFLNFAAQEMTKMPEPFLSGIFTLSSHNPYALPSDLSVEEVERFTTGTTHPLQKVLRYADASLEAFFKTASEAPWYNRTLFVVTGDHTSSSEHESYQNDLGFNRVPILLYAPALEFHQGLSKKLAQHTDIPCTVLLFAGEGVGARTPRSPFCRSLVEGGSRGRVLLHAGGTYNLVTPRYWTRKTPDGRHVVFPSGEKGGWGVAVSGNASEVSPEVSAHLNRLLEAGVQSFNNGLNENAFYR